MEDNNLDKIANSDVFQMEEKGFSSFKENGKAIIKVIGVGGGGCNAVNYMYKQNIPGVTFVVTNTDYQALKQSPVPTHVQLGKEGLGAGNIPDVARQAAEETADKLGDLFDDDTEMVFITAGMGGGTGTGASPVVARIAREHGMLTVGIVTVPFIFEGMKKIEKALAGAEEMRKYVDALLLINNQRLNDIYSDLDFDNAFDKADETLTDAARSISEMINTKGKINLDFKDVKTTLENGGTAIISTGYGEGENRVTKAIEDALNSPLLKNRDVQSSKRILFNLYYSPNAEHKLKMGETQEIEEFMINFSHDVDVIWGTSLDDTLGDKVKITILASGFDVSLNDEVKVKGQSRTIFGRPKPQPEKPEPKPDTQQEIKDIYGTDKIDAQKRKKASANYIILTPNQMDNDVLINFFEKNPTYRRGNDNSLREEWRQISETKPAAQPAAKPAATPGTEEKNSREIEF